MALTLQKRNNHHTIGKNTKVTTTFLIVGKRLYRMVAVFFVVLIGAAILTIKYPQDEFSIGTSASKTQKLIHGKNALNISKEELMCFWKPEDPIAIVPLSSSFSSNGNDNNDDDRRKNCVFHLANRIHATRTKSSSSSLEPITRWIFLGDSTMWRLYSYSPLSKVLSQEPPCPDFPCKPIHGGRCNTLEIFGYSQPKKWKSPNDKQEGPRGFGLKNPYCQDCQGCNSNIFFCSRKNIVVDDDNGSSSSSNASPCNQSSILNPTGGYVSVEFASDVEIQSTKYKTTQENLAHWLNDQWNTPLSIQELGRPVCVLSTGNHDAGIARITTETYLNNVYNYLQLLSDQCIHFVWLANTCPATEEYPQKIQQTQDWNLGVLDILHTHFASKSSFVDVFDSSRKSQHSDNVHMSSSWYKNLGRMFEATIASVSGLNTTLEMKPVKIRVVDVNNNQ